MVDKWLTTDTFDPTALDSAGYVSYVSAYESGTTAFDPFFLDDEDTEYMYRAAETEDYDWMNFQMEFYGILNGMMPEMDEDTEICFRWALPVSNINLAGEMYMESEGGNKLLHTLFKIFIYYPFDRMFHETYTGLANEHDCIENMEDGYSEDD